MKKQITAIFLTAAMAIGGVPAMAADNDMEAALVSVKSRVDIPAELNEFESSYYISNDEPRYSFEWSSPYDTADISVGADRDGHILYYYYFSSEIYKGADILVYKTRDEYYAAAESFLKKAAPELFGSDDRLVNIKSNNAIRDNSAEFHFERHRNGIPIVNNNADITVDYVDGKFVITNCHINWDYKTEFDAKSSGGTINPALYYESFPLELVYTKSNRVYRYAANTEKEIPKLIYRFKDYKAGYMSSETGEIVEPDMDDDYYIYNRAAGSDSGAAAEESAKALTPEERAELENVSDLATKEQIIEAVNSEGVFGTMPSPDKFSSTAYKRDDKYYVSLEYYDYDVSNDDEPYNISICVDGQNGELISYACYYEYSSDKAADDEYDKAAEIVGEYLKKNYEDKLTECGEGEVTKENTYRIEYHRLVNGVKYDDNYIYASYDIKHNVIRYFDCVWDDDTSYFTDSAKAVSYDAALAKMEEYDPVRLAYVKSGDEFKLCYTSDGARAEIDAVTGERVNAYTYEEPTTYTYTDINGHWAEEMIKAVAQYGAGLPGAEFSPDTEITQAELLRMLAATSYYFDEDTEAMYRNAQDIIPESEKAPDSAVLREDAFVYVIRLMGFAKIASMNDIFRPGFTDGTEVSPDKAGALAILRGYGIVQGDADSVRPKDKLTRAEAAALVYGYLTTEK